MSREGINAAQAFFDRNGSVFHEIPQQHDFGKDGYLDFGERGDHNPPLCRASDKIGTVAQEAEWRLFYSGG